jgi:hypothetical protein
MHNPPSHPRAAPSGPHLQVVTRSVRQATRNDNPLPSSLPPSHLTHRECYNKKKQSKKKTRPAQPPDPPLPSAQRKTHTAHRSTAQRITAGKHNANATYRVRGPRERGQTWIWNGTQRHKRHAICGMGIGACRFRGFELPFAASVPLPARVGSLLRATGLLWPSRCCLMLCCRTFAALQYISLLTVYCILAVRTGTGRCNFESECLSECLVGGSGSGGKVRRYKKVLPVHPSGTRI